MNRFNTYSIVLENGAKIKRNMNHSLISNPNTFNAIYIPCTDKNILKLKLSCGPRLYINRYILHFFTDSVYCVYIERVKKLD